MQAKRYDLGEHNWSEEGAIVTLRLAKHRLEGWWPSRPRGWADERKGRLRRAALFCLVFGDRSLFHDGIVYPVAVLALVFGEQRAVLDA